MMKKAEMSDYLKDIEFALDCVSDIRKSTMKKAIINIRDDIRCKTI